MAVSISFYNPSNYLTNLKSLVTLNTLKTLANCGPAFKNEMKEFPENSNTISKMEAQTTKKSN